MAVLGYCAATETFTTAFRSMGLDHAEQSSGQAIPSESRATNGSTNNPDDTISHVSGGDGKDEIVLKVLMNGAKGTAGDPGSLPPSPPDSGDTTPRVRIAPCPERLRSFIPPPNYGTVDYKKIYRGSYPQARNIGFMKTLQIKNVLTFVATEPNPGYQQWIDEHGIRRTQIDIAPNKDGNVQTTIQSICHALLYILDSSHYPLLIHCNQGKHRTGCVVACLRKVQRWSLRDIVSEYAAYAGSKVREGDIKLITDFDPNCVFDFAKQQGYFGDSGNGDNEASIPSTIAVSCDGTALKRLDSAIVNIDMLAEALLSGALVDPTGEITSSLSAESTGTVSPPSSSNASATSDVPLEMAWFKANMDVGPVSLEHITSTDASESMMIEDVDSHDTTVKIVPAPSTLTMEVSPTVTESINSATDACMLDFDGAVTSS